MTIQYQNLKSFIKERFTDETAKIIAELGTKHAFACLLSSHDAATIYDLYTDDVWAIIQQSADDLEEGSIIQMIATDPDSSKKIVNELTFKSFMAATAIDILCIEIIVERVEGGAE